jgi:Coenzyme PQQ synthesis protein D (PqqD)
VIGERDTLRFAPGVALEGDRLSDVVRGTSWPLNASGAFVLARAAQPIGETVHALARAYSLPPDEARDDVLQFVWSLNRLALVNVESDGSRARRLRDWAKLAARLAPAGALPAILTRRRALDTRSVPRAVATCLAATSARCVFVAAVALALTAQVVAVGAAGLAAWLALGIATGTGLGLHEAGHAALLRGVPSALVTCGRRTSVLHAALGPTRRSLVALGGPLGVSALGFGIVAAGWLAAVPVLVLAGCPLAAHALALTVVGGDGKVLCGL